MTDIQESQKQALTQIEKLLQAARESVEEAILLADQNGVSFHWRPGNYGQYTPRKEKYILGDPEKRIVRHEDTDWDNPDEVDDFGGYYNGYPGWDSSSC